MRDRVDHGPLWRLRRQRTEVGDITHDPMPLSFPPLKSMRGFLQPLHRKRDVRNTIASSVAVSANSWVDGADGGVVRRVDVIFAASAQPAMQTRIPDEGSNHALTTIRRGGRGRGGSPVIVDVKCGYMGDDVADFVHVDVHQTCSFACARPYASPNTLPVSLGSGIVGNRVKGQNASSSTAVEKGPRHQPDNSNPSLCPEQTLCGLGEHRSQHHGGLVGEVKTHRCQEQTSECEVRVK